MKAPISLLPKDSLFEVAKCMGLGEGKHQSDNYQTGCYTYRHFADKIGRHLLEFTSGEDFDREDGQHHIAAVAANALMLLWVVLNKPELDDRKPQIKLSESTVEEAHRQYMASIKGLDKAEKQVADSRETFAHTLGAVSG